MGKAIHLSFPGFEHLAQAFRRRPCTVLQAKGFSGHLELHLEGSDRCLELMGRDREEFVPGPKSILELSYCLLLVVNVGVGSKPTSDLTVLIPKRLSATQMPSVDTIAP